MTAEYRNISVLVTKNTVLFGCGLYQIVFNYIIINRLYVASSHYISDPFLKVINGLAANKPSGSSNRCCSFEQKQESDIVWIWVVMNHSEIIKHFSIIIKKQRDRNLDTGICLRIHVSNILIPTNIFTQPSFCEWIGCPRAKLL